MKSRKERRKGKSKKKMPPGILFFVIFIVSIFLIYYLFFIHLPSNGNSGKPFQKAAIVDHLSLTAPNQTFIQTATNILENAGYTVDYYPGEKVDVEFYRYLPVHYYGLIILRVHSALKDPEGHPLVFFTSENWSSSKYQQEQLDFPGLPARIVPVAYTPEDFEKGEIYFGINPEFVKRDMKGTFVNTTIVMMGCNGLTYDEMAKALTNEKRAKVYIGWSKAVSVSHTDQATIQLLEHLITENQTIKEAVDEISPDPAHDSMLGYYPENTEVESYVIPKPESNLTTNVAETNPKIEKLTMAKIMKKSEKTSTK